MYYINALYSMNKNYKPVRLLCVPQDSVNVRSPEHVPSGCFETRAICLKNYPLRSGLVSGIGEAVIPDILGRHFANCDPRAFSLTGRYQMYIM